MLLNDEDVGRVTLSLEVGGDVAEDELELESEYWPGSSARSLGRNSECIDLERADRRHVGEGRWNELAVIVE